MSFTPDDMEQRDGGRPDEGPGSPRGKARRLLVSPPVVTTVLLLLVIAVSGMAWYASSWKREVKVSRVVVSGERLLSAKVLERALQPFSGRKLAGVREEEIRRVLASEPYIRELAIGKELNGIIRVTIVEHQPVARTLFMGVPMVVDAEGMLLPDNGVSSRFHRLPAVYGIGGAVPARAGAWRMPAGDSRMLDSIITAFGGSEYAGLLLQEIHLAPANQSWFLVTGSPTKFILGNHGNFKEKLKKFEIFWQKVIAKKGLDSYEAVDLRFRERVFAREPGADVALPAPPDTSSAAPDSIPAPTQSPRAELH